MSTTTGKLIGDRVAPLQLWALVMAEWQQRIADLMVERDVNQSELAAAVGIRQAAVHKWISGKTGSIEGANLVAVAKVLQTTAEYVMTGKNPPSQSVRLDSTTLANAVYLAGEAIRLRGDSDPLDPTDPVDIEIITKACNWLQAEQISGKPSDSNLVEFMRSMGAKKNDERTGRTGTTAGKPIKAQGAEAPSPATGDAEDLAGSKRKSA